jgi:hypothetical protein
MSRPLSSKHISLAYISSSEKSALTYTSRKNKLSTLRLIYHSFINMSKNISISDISYDTTTLTLSGPTESCTCSNREDAY